MTCSLREKTSRVVDICTPPALHHEFAIRAANGGKHIIMEKPLTKVISVSPVIPEPIGTRVPRARMREGARFEQRRSCTRSCPSQWRKILLRGKLDLRAAD